MEPRNARLSEGSLDFRDIMRQGPRQDEIERNQLAARGRGYRKAGQVLGV